MKTCNQYCCVTKSCKIAWRCYSNGAVPKQGASVGMMCKVTKMQIRQGSGYMLRRCRCLITLRGQSEEVIRRGSVFPRMRMQQSGLRWNRERVHGRLRPPTPCSEIEKRILEKENCREACLVVAVGSAAE